MARNGTEKAIPIHGSTLCRFDFREIGYPFSARTIPTAVRETFFLKQYECENSHVSIRAKDSDYILDIGGCYGDTALYFAYLAGPQGKVFSFEFVPSSVEIFEQNLSINPNLRKRVTLVRKAVHSISGEHVAFLAMGPSSTLRPGAGGSHVATTVTLDDYVKEAQLPKVNFIKMDIEGSEMSALMGARETLRKFQPQVAIAVYHKHDDITRISNFLLTVNPNYRFYLRHFTIGRSETILFATSDQKPNNDSISIYF